MYLIALTSLTFFCYLTPLDKEEGKKFPKKSDGAHQGMCNSLEKAGLGCKEENLGICLSWW
jgi:hypothetical protein